MEINITPESLNLTGMTVHVDLLKERKIFEHKRVFDDFSSTWLALTKIILTSYSSKRKEETSEVALPKIK